MRPEPTKIAFWTYRASQKALNLARDPPITCLVDSAGDRDRMRQEADAAGTTLIGSAVVTGHC